MLKLSTLSVCFEFFIKFVSIKKKEIERWKWLIECSSSPDSPFSLFFFFFFFFIASSRYYCHVDRICGQETVFNKVRLHCSNAGDKRSSRFFHVRREQWSTNNYGYAKHITRVTLVAGLYRAFRSLETICFFFFFFFSLHERELRLFRNFDENGREWNICVEKRKM